MVMASLRSRVLWLTASFVVLTAIPWPLAAQQPAQPQPPPSWQQGRPGGIRFLSRRIMAQGQPCTYSLQRAYR